jgi:hypothetical protein
LPKEQDAGMEKIARTTRQEQNTRGQLTLSLRELMREVPGNSIAENGRYRSCRIDAGQ